jgi:hypothetical protein
LLEIFSLIDKNELFGDGIKFHMCDLMLYVLGALDCENLHWREKGWGGEELFEIVVVVIILSVGLDDFLDFFVADVLVLGETEVEDF